MFYCSPPGSLPDHEKERHPNWRRYTCKYRRKKRIVRDVWIISGILMIGAPLGAILVLLLATTLLSFVILDETA